MEKVIEVSEQEFWTKPKTYLSSSMSAPFILRYENESVCFVAPLTSAQPASKKSDAVDDDDPEPLSLRWYAEFMAIPDKYRCNPFDISPSGDLFWADTRNVRKLEQDLKQADEDMKSGNVTCCKTKEDLKAFFDSL
ncbi:hypothetical protein FACS189467_8080 [Bacteroidia bacterium]|nr:hypothetical protein FACS189467_8080 [Bacteroidia bacterium]